MKKHLLAALTCASLFSCQKEAVVSTVNETSPTTNVSARALTTLSFSGYTWIVTSSGTDTQGPGPNHFSASNAWVDTDGFLHLKLAKNPTTQNWECAEVTLNQNLGYGKYQWKVEGAIDKLDKNVVFGMFNYSGNDGYDEMDIEYSRWGYATNNNLDFTLYPATGSSQSSVEVTPLVNLTGTYTTHRITRYGSDSVKFQSIGGFYDNNTNVYASKTWANPPYSISTLSMPVMMNLWLYNGVAPSNGQNVEIIIHEFKFTPQ
ncbi:hypothetical protein SAMN05428988_4403 [Chitinophaga sp. YR573]|uniref:glycoside hydrolase family 16 protein n=1 Tax=Chitinophaga sp. YR573 TaxID=1881040 RepID=UPI0008ABBD55|nr:glycoside hydrolase family 16 protein [Chitinophaga sp. YR573]SEW35850.1 hypothetical protein SAMN05428988_4403 [Chitinophaga sp. YR573]